MPFLKYDVYSMMNISKCYAKAGQEVNIISISAPAAIVELAEAPYLRFPCLAMDISETPLASALNIADPGKAAGKITKKGRWKAGEVKVETKAEQKTLFS